MNQAVSRKKSSASAGKKRRSSSKTSASTRASNRANSRSSAAQETVAVALQRFAASVASGSAALADFLWAERRRVAPWLMVVLALFGAVLLFRTLASSQVMPLQRLEVVGEFKQLQVADVVLAARPHARSGFFAVDLNQVRKAVEQLPWVDSVQVDRVWPDALRIHVIEQNPYGLWRSPSGEPGLMNYDGVVFAKGEAAASYRAAHPGAQDGTAPELIGAAEDGALLAVVYRRLLPTLDGRLRSLELTDRGDWQATLSTADGQRSIELRLGQQPFDERLQRFLKLQRSEPLAARLADVAYMDMRYPHGAAIGWREADLADAR